MTENWENNGMTEIGLVTHFIHEVCRQWRALCLVWVFVAQLWWRHQMETFCALQAICAGYSPVTGEFPAQRPVTRNFDVFFNLRLNKRLSKQSWGWWFETPSCSLWRHCNDVALHFYRIRVKIGSSECTKKVRSWFPSKNIMFSINTILHLLNCSFKENYFWYSDLMICIFVRNVHCLLITFGLWPYKTFQLSQKTITVVPSHECQGVPNLRQLGFLFNSVFRPTTEDTPILSAVCEGRPSLAGGFSSQRTSNAETTSMSWRHHDGLYLASNVRFTEACPASVLLSVQKVSLKSDQMMGSPVSLSLCSARVLIRYQSPMNYRKKGNWRTWWCHQMETFSALLALCAGNSPVTGEFPSQRPVTLSFDVFCDLRLE